MTMRGNRASSKPSRGEAIGSSPPRLRSPPRQPLKRALRAFPHAQLPSFIGRAEALSRLHRAWDARMQRQALRGLGCRRARYRQDHADRALRRGPRRHRLCARPVRGALRHGRAVSPCSRSARASCAAPTTQSRRCCAPWRRPGCCSCRGSAARRSATRLRRELAGVSPHRMLREMGELLDRYTEGRPLLLVTEDLHWSDRSTIQLIDYIARRRGSARLMWLCELSSRRGGRAGSSAQPGAAGAAPARAVRGDRARSVLRDRGRRLRGGTLADRLPATRRSCARCTSAPTEFRCSWRLS